LPRILRWCERRGFGKLKEDGSAESVIRTVKTIGGGDEVTQKFLKVKLTIEEKNGELLERVRDFSSTVSHLSKNPHGIELNFKARCLERLYTLMKLAADNCFSGFPVTATLMARGVIETAGLLVLFESKMKKATGSGTKERLEAIKKFVFSTKKFGNEKRSVHALDCVRALTPYHPDVELLYDILCEAVHPNWLGVSQFREFQAGSSDTQEHDELVSMTVIQALLLGHKVSRTVNLPISIGAGRGRRETQ
jgi:hypothetical protein